MEKAKDAFHSGLDSALGCLEPIAEILFGLLACGLIALAWWSFQSAPYPTVAIGVGVLLIAGYGILSHRRAHLLGRLAVAGIVAAVLVFLLLTYLPYCDCL